MIIIDEAGFTPERRKAKEIRFRHQLKGRVYQHNGGFYNLEA